MSLQDQRFLHREILDFRKQLWWWSLVKKYWFPKKRQLYSKYKQIRHDFDWILTEFDLLCQYAPFYHYPNRSDFVVLDTTFRELEHFVYTHYPEWIMYDVQ